MLVAKNHSITVRINDKQYDQLVTISNGLNISMAEVIRQALERWYNSEYTLLSLQ